MVAAAEVAARPFEVAVRLRSVAALADFRARRGGPGASGPMGEPAYASFDGWPRGVEELEAAIGEATVTRVYVGAEFCEHLLPTTEELALECSHAVREDVALTLVTPPVTDEGLALVRELAHVFAGSTVRDPEIVVNDWGTLEALSEPRIPRVKLVLGRCLVKFQKDPAVVEHYRNRAGEGADSFAPLRMSALAGAPLRALLEKAGVERLEVDALPQGFPSGVSDGAIAASAHVPYGYVSSGRVCLVGSLALPRLERFTPQTRCPRPCEGLDAEMRAPSPTLPRSAGEGERLFLKGNTAFFHMGWGAAAGYAKDALRGGANRIVVTPRPEA